jgi:hypothetical protein
VISTNSKNNDPSILGIMDHHFYDSKLYYANTLSTDPKTPITIVKPTN